jgi:hypothetical protein
MSDFFHPPTEQKARKRHVCTYCANHIEHGERYTAQSGVYEGDYYTNKFHAECWAELLTFDEFEFCPGEGMQPGKPAGFVSARRIQLKRSKGWRMPDNTVKVDRSTKWGNPFLPTAILVSSGKGTRYKQGEPIGVEGAIAAFRTAVEHKLRRGDVELQAAIERLRGRNLACWCKRGAACHADVLLEIANRVK